MQTKTGTAIPGGGHAISPKSMQNVQYSSLETHLNSQEGTKTTDDIQVLRQESVQPRYELMTIVSCLYLFHGLGSATWGRFSCIYYITRGLSTFQIGIIEGCMPAMKLFCGVLWGWLADYTKSKKYVYLGCRFTSSAILCLLAFHSIATGFTAILILSIINVSFVCMGVLEAYAIEICGDQKDALYGKIRVWQSVAAGLGAVMMGAITDHLGFTANFIGWGILALINCALILLYIPNRTEIEKQKIALKCGDLMRVLLREWWFFVLILVFGFGIGVIDKLLFIYLTKELHGSNTFCGATVAVTVVIEIPLFFYGKHILNWLSRDLMIAIALLAYVIRVFGYTFLTPETKWFIIPLEILHGAGFSNVWLVSISYSSDVVPPQWMSTMQALIRSIYLSVGAGIGAVVGGKIMQDYGAATMYSAYGWLVAVFFVLHCIAWLTGMHSFDDTSEKKAIAQGYTVIMTREEETALIQPTAGGGKYSGGVSHEDDEEEVGWGGGDLNKL